MCEINRIDKTEMVFPKEVLRHWAFCVPSPTSKSPDCHSGKRCAAFATDRPTSAARKFETPRGTPNPTTESPVDLTQASSMDHALQHQHPIPATRPGPESPRPTEQGLAVAEPFQSPPRLHRNHHSPAQHVPPRSHISPADVVASSNAAAVQRREEPTHLDPVTNVG